MPTRQGPSIQFDWPQQTTTAAYATLDEVKPVLRAESINVAIENLNVTGNSVFFRILGSVDDGSNFDFTVVSETSIAAGAVETATISGPYTHLKVEIKDNAGTDDVAARAAGYDPSA